MQTLRRGSLLQGGKYIIERELGQGTFGITYLAHTTVTVGGALGNMQTTVNVAIKEFFMREMNTRKEGSAVVEGSSSELVRNYRRKFRTEAENLSRMQHPSIVKVLDVFDENGTTYYVMEYIEGQSLDDFVCQMNGLSTNEALGIVRQIADAVGYMHRHKMLHLDIKPKNVMMNSKGKAFLIDFGLSKQYTDDGRPESSTTLGLGTPGYAPMEQASYKPDGSFPATLDIYALGATLYKMLTGKTPPDSPTVFNDGLDCQPMMAHNVPSWLQDAVKKTMSPGKRQRPQTVEEFIALIGGTARDLVDDIVEEPVKKSTFGDVVKVIETAQAKKTSGKCHPQMVDGDKTVIETASIVLAQEPKTTTSNAYKTVKKSSTNSLKNSTRTKPTKPNGSKKGHTSLSPDHSANIIPFVWVSGFVLVAAFLIIFPFAGEMRSTEVDRWTWYYIGCLLAFICGSFACYLEYDNYYSNGEWYNTYAWQVDGGEEGEVVKGCFGLAIVCPIVLVIIGIIYYGAVGDGSPVYSGVTPIIAMGVFYGFWHGVFFVLRFLREHLGDAVAHVSWIIGLLLLLVALVSVLYSIFTYDSSSLSKNLAIDNKAEGIDLGLPSGTIWADRNVGATKPEENGTLYAWGEVKPKDKYTIDNYFDYKGIDNGVRQYKAINIQNGFKSIIGTECDVAATEWGEEWVMPSIEQIRELATECKWKFDKKNGVRGMIITGPNGNFIFLPAAGYGNEYGFGILEGDEGNYWCGELCENNKHDHKYYDPGIAVDGTSGRAFNFEFMEEAGWTFTDNNYIVGCSQRYFGCSIRPVKANNVPMKTRKRETNNNSR